MQQDAVISPDEKYRYMLSRSWDESLLTCMFVMLNPSTADARIDDPTIRRCIGFSKKWGYGKLVVGNLFAARSTNPINLRTISDPVGELNKDWLDRMMDETKAGGGICVGGWGVNGTYMDQDQTTIGWFEANNVPLYALETSLAGHPKHPLYVRGDKEPRIWIKP